MYILYDKFETKLREYSFSNYEGIVFYHRINDDNVVTLKHEIEDENALKKIDTSRKVFKIVDFVPPTNGCAFCKFKKEIDNNFFYCAFYERTKTKEIKKCKYFKQRKLYKT